MDEHGVGERYGNLKKVSDNCGYLSRPQQVPSRTAKLQFFLSDP